MSRRFYLTCIWVWMTALLASGVGVSIQQVYCYCVGKTTVSLFVADDACRAEPSLPNCCKQEQVPPKAACCEKKNAGNHEGCTKKTTKVFQLKTAFEVGHFSLKKLDAPKVWKYIPAFPSPVLPSRSIFAAADGRFERPPPYAPGGRMLCVRYGIFRC
ncbi:MAG: hypothetical protein SFV22_09475 [Saprospiraceae bacterium]|nr:hypothetical protein [Saprospiraceae bacterium]